MITSVPGNVNCSYLEMNEISFIWHSITHSPKKQIRLQLNYFIVNRMTFGKSHNRKYNLQCCSAIKNTSELFLIILLYYGKPNIQSNVFVFPSYNSSFHSVSSRFSVPNFCFASFIKKEVWAKNSIFRYFSLKFMYQDRKVSGNVYV